MRQRDQNLEQELQAQVVRPQNPLMDRFSDEAYKAAISAADMDQTQEVAKSPEPHYSPTRQQEYYRPVTQITSTRSTDRYECPKEPMTTTKTKPPPC